MPPRRSGVRQRIAGGSADLNRGNRAVEFAFLMEQRLPPQRGCALTIGGQARLCMKRLADG